MKVSITYVDKEYKKHKELVEKFCAFLQKHFPLTETFRIQFLPERTGSMTTGSRSEDNLLKVLTKGRLNRDILRTLAHEWVHEYQRTVLKREHGPNIGGKNEDEANAEAGKLMKMFEEEYPELDGQIYESKGIEKKLNLISEQILLTEVHNLRKDILTEMKRIGIEKLPYSYASLRSFVDARTMDIHYNKHYKGYVKKLNAALKGKDGDMDLEEIIKSISKFDDKVRNNGGGAFNHALFWKMLSPKKQIPKGEIAKKIKSDFGNIKKLKDEFNEVAKTRFGSGWAWLVLGKDNKLKIMSTPNQDNPLMDVVKGGGYPLLGLDVWEHAYYLKYQNKRDEYISKFWNHVNWEFVEELYQSKTKKKTLKESDENKEIISEDYNQTKLGLSPKQIRLLISSVYSKCNNRKNPNGCIGKIKTEECITSEGVIGGRYTEGNYGGIGNWSIVNRFDTNSRVHNKILEIYQSEGVDKNLQTWVTKNAKNLFGNNGKYTQSLVDVNSKTIQTGRKNENFAKSKIIEAFNLKPEDEGITWFVYERCAGDTRDRKYGQDLDVKIDGVLYHYQVKPTLVNLIKKIDSERGFYYKIPSYHKQTKYKEDKVDVIVYVDEPKGKFIMFRNDYNKIQTLASNQYNGPKFMIYYYEEPINSNIDFNIESEKQNVDPKPRLERNKENLAQEYQKRIKYFQDKLKELGYDDSINEVVKFLKSKHQKIITD